MSETVNTRPPARVAKCDEGAPLTAEQKPPTRIGFQLVAGLEKGHGD